MLGVKRDKGRVGREIKETHKVPKSLATLKCTCVSQFVYARVSECKCIYHTYVYRTVFPCVVTHYPEKLSVDPFLPLPSPHSSPTPQVLHDWLPRLPLSFFPTDYYPRQDYGDHYCLEVLVPCCYLLQAGCASEFPFLWVLPSLCLMLLCRLLPYGTSTCCQAL